MTNRSRGSPIQSWELLQGPPLCRASPTAAAAALLGMTLEVAYLAPLLLLLLLTGAKALSFGGGGPRSALSRARSLVSTCHSMSSSMSQDDVDIGALRMLTEQKKREWLDMEIELKKMEREINRSYNGSGSASIIQSGTYDYGFLAKTAANQLGEKDESGRSTVPASALVLALENFRREFGNIIEAAAPTPSADGSGVQEKARAKLRQLKLSNDAVWRREAKREKIVAPFIIKIPYYLLCLLLDSLFHDKPIARFYFLETVARIPYYSYITMIHSYETLGWWRRSTEMKRVHFAEEYNEYHHLLIWESLGGDQEWSVRFFAQHSAIVYFFILVGLWLTSPTLAYNFSELIEMHAVDTYSEFAEANKELLQSMDAPPIAKAYYESPDLYIFDEFQTDKPRGTRRPVIRNLYDVVIEISDDESAHVSTMAACQDKAVILKSPNTEFNFVLSTALAAVLAYYLDTNLDDDTMLEAFNTFLSYTSASTLGGGTGVDINEAVEAGENSTGMMALADELILALKAGLSRILGLIKFL